MILIIVLCKINNDDNIVMRMENFIVYKLLEVV